MAKSGYQIKIELMSSKPAIWRRVLIPSDMLLNDFHYLIQTVMGWTNSHMYQFVKGNVYYLEKDPEFGWDNGDDIDIRKKKVKVSDLLQSEKDKIVYEYDFGDSWMHNIKLEKILPYDKTQKYPVCVAGKMNCPPEDCGGVWGYAHLLEVIGNPEHEEYADYEEWRMEDFDPEYFNVDEVNEMLHGKRRQ